MTDAELLAFWEWWYTATGVCFGVLLGMCLSAFLRLMRDSRPEHLENP